MNATCATAYHRRRRRHKERVCRLSQSAFSHGDPPSRYRDSGARMDCNTPPLRLI